MRREASPAGDAHEAETVERGARRRRRRGGRGCGAPRRWRGFQSPATGAAPPASRARRAELVPGARCCQRSSQCMNWAAVTGSICLRRVATVRWWMRASRRRSHHSISRKAALALRRKWPRRMAPVASRRKSEASMEAGEMREGLAFWVIVSEAVFTCRQSLRRCERIGV